jgi:membrane dipeptidase
MHLIVDGHLDLSMNAMEWNRDLTCAVEEIREQEKGMTDKPDRSHGTVSFCHAQRKVGLCIATQIARYVSRTTSCPGGNHLPGQAMTRGQLEWYRAMEEAGEMVQITNKEQLEQHLKVA